MRHLATIRSISELQPIEGKDRIELAFIDGWQVIVKKGEFVPGDLCIYIEIDSVLPERPEFEFLRSKNFRIRTIKMGGVISQGICFPLSFLPGDMLVTPGEDVTDILGITKYESDSTTSPKETPQKKYPIFLMRRLWFRKLLNRKKKDDVFPSFFSKTDEVRIQNATQYLSSSELWTATEKIDGCSASYALRKVGMTILFNPKYEFIVCSRNKKISQDDGSVYWKIAESLNIHKALEQLIGDNEYIVLQGEIIGPKIQKNKYDRILPEFYAFNLILSESGRLSSIEMRNRLDTVGISTVPIISVAAKLPNTVNELMAVLVHGKSALADILREGIVFRSWDGKRSFKAVDPEFLLSYNE